MNLLVTHAPHIRSNNSTKSMMEQTFRALIPAAIFGVYIFGTKALVLIITSIISCMVFEFIACKIRNLPLYNLGPAALTGLFIAFVVSSAATWWMMVIGAFIAIIISKHMFGGLGFNIFNPALVARAFLAASWPVAMTTWLKPFDTVTTATPLAFVKSQGTEIAMKVANNPNLSAFAKDPGMSLSKMAEHIPVYWQLLIGNIGGTIGETSALILLLGGLFLMFRKVVEWRIPVSYISTVGIMSVLAGKDPIFHILAGGVMLGAFFMATDLVTSPIGKKGRLLFGFGCGFITMAIRFWGGYPEGVCYSILIMNAFVPLIDRYIPDRIYGYKK